MEFKSYKGPVHSPWGNVQSRQEVIPGVVLIVTASHGGVWLSSQRAKALPEAVKKYFYAGDQVKRFYEEDVEIFVIGLAFYDEWSKKKELPELSSIHDTVKNWFPGLYEEWFEVKLTGDESFIRARQEFENKHANDWVVISASKHPDEDDKVVCCATLGGIIGHNVPKNWFVVDKAEYDPGRFGFVIDLKKHSPTTARF